MSSLPTTLRRQLETACKHGRTVASIGARKALEALAVHEPNPYWHMDEAQRDLRRKLRAQARQLGDVESQEKPGGHEIKHLVEKLAYDQWHRLLFARFLLENNLLISPEHEVSVSLEDCQELAPSVGLKDAWAVAARFAAKELPEIFRADDPAGAAELPVEDRKQLVQLVTGLPVEVFTASDSLGWCYQFWQAEQKDQVNAAGNKIGADELPAVTQLFTEDYMVDFLLDNTLGAWHGAKVLAANPTLAEAAQNEEELRNAVVLPRCHWKYLRFIRAGNANKWTPAAGAFAGWPKTTQELKCLDPSMGSGHFVVAMFERLVALRMAEEKCDESMAVAAVIRDNLFGLEIDPRCTQIAAFNLALAAWRRVGHCKLPAMNLACSGLAPNAKKEDWLKLAADNERLRNGMELLYQLFEDAPVLGSLINPRAAEGDLLVAAFHELQPLLEQALAKETKDDTAYEMAVAARGLAKAAETLAGQFTLVATNVPYLMKGKQCPELRQFCESHAKDASADLATVFVDRCADFCAKGGTHSTVTPQNWLFLTTYSKFRKRLLTNNQFCHVTAVGSGATATASWDVLRALVIVSVGAKPGCLVTGIETEAAQEAERARDLRSNPLICVTANRLVENPDSRIALIAQTPQLRNPDAVVTFGEPSAMPLLETVADAPNGSHGGDSKRHRRVFWELGSVNTDWRFFQGTVEETKPYGGREFLFSWFEDGRIHRDNPNARIQGETVTGKFGVVVSMMRELPVTLYCGDLFDISCTPIVPKKQEHLAAIWAFCSSRDYFKAVRKIDKKLNVTNATLAKVPFDLAHWQKVAADKYPHGLPKPFSSDPTQWLFNGYPKSSDQPLHVAVARLLGYQWPRQTGSSFLDCPALASDGLDRLADQDGIVCLYATKGEGPAAERLRSLLVQALGSVDLNALIANAGPKGSKSDTLEEWLRDEFFEQHCTLFQHRPFVWHVWDGHKGGFSALVNYHKLTHANLEKLTYVYLGDWIRRQQAAVEGGEAGSDVRLQVAKQLQARLKLILEGEPPYDLFVRWKPLSKQATGWHPEINDGVRMNIRPFAAADILRKRVKIKWDKDRGNEPVRDKKDFPWFWGWDEETQDFAGVGDAPDGNRWNDCHYTNEFKRKANAAR